MSPQTTTPPRTVAYLVNQYPKVSHSFIRREIHALERMGITVHRFAHRGWDADPVDPDDRAELAVTRYLLRGGLRGLLSGVATAFAASPIKWLQALRLAWRTSRRSDRSLPHHLIYLAEACVLLQELRRCGASHLHAHFGTNAAEVAMLARVLGGPPYSFTVHGPEEFDKPEALHLAAKADHAAFVVAVSSFGRSQLYRWVAPASWPKIQVVHCGLQPGYHGCETQAAGLGSKRLVCVGRICEQKGQLLLVEAARRLLDQGLPFELVLAGDGEMRPQVERLVRALGLGAHVRITGWISAAQVREELLAARALVLPSFAEGLPVVIMESLALGRPVITTFVAGIPELVRQGACGWLVPAGDVQALSEAMAECLATEPARLKDMGHAGRLRIQELHNVDTEARRLAEHLFGAARPEFEC